MVLLRELLPLAILAVPIVVFGRRALIRRRARWTVEVRALRRGGYEVRLVRPGQPSQVVRQIPAGTDSAELSDALAEGKAEAQAQAAALNASMRG